MKAKVTTLKGKEVRDALKSEEMKQMLEEERKKAERTEKNFKPFEVRLMYDSSDDSVLFMSPDKKTFNSVDVSYLMTQALSQLVTQHSLYKSVRRNLIIAHICNILLIATILIKLFIVK